MNFTVHRADGTTVALVECVLDAQRINRETDDARYVLRVSDGEVMARKVGRAKATRTQVLS